MTTAGAASYPSERTGRGVALMCLSSLAFSVMGVCIKELRAAMAASEVVFFRSAISVLLCGYAIARLPAPRLPVIVGRRRGLLVLRGLFGFASLYAYVFALGRIPYADAAALLYTSPVFTALFAAGLLRESLPRGARVGLPLCLLGSLAVLRPGLGTELAGGLAALGAGVGSGLAYTSVRALAKSESIQTIVLYFALVSLPLAGIAMLDGWVTPDAAQWGWVVAMGVSAQAGQVLLTAAFRAGRAGAVATGAFAVLALSAVWGWAWFGESLDAMTLLGALAIAAGIVCAGR